jgi:hypothetical protein
MPNQDYDNTAAPPDQHIVVRNGTWAVVPEGSDDPIRTFDSRDEALQWAARSLNHQGANLIVYNEDGSINDTIRPEA